MYTVICTHKSKEFGNRVQVVGPFPSFEAAHNWIEKARYSCRFQIAPLQPPEMELI